MKAIKDSFVCDFVLYPFGAGAPVCIKRLQEEYRQNGNAENEMKLLRKCAYPNCALWKKPEKIENQ